MSAIFDFPYTSVITRVFKMGVSLKLKFRTGIIKNTNFTFMLMLTFAVYFIQTTWQT